MSKLLFSIQGCTLDDLVWFLLLEHLKTTPPWPRERERRTISPLQPSTGQGKPVESSPFLDNGVILRKICKKKNPWIYKLCKSEGFFVGFVSIKYPLLRRLSRSDESDKADIVVNLLFSKQQTTLSLAEKFYFYRRGRGGQIIGERKSNAPMVCSLP